MLRCALLLLPLILPFLAACGLLPSASDVEGRSLLGAPLERIEPEGERLERLEQDLADARVLWNADPTEAHAIWVGRRIAYLGRYREALAWYSARIAEHPNSYRLLRHRGHRRISVRDFEGAEVDLSKAWLLAQSHPNQLEPDGAPNEYGIPRSSDHGNILYHLALALHLQGRWNEAAAMWKAAEDAALNDDSRAAALNWRFHALVRAGRAPEARRAVADVRSRWRIIENHAYLDLCLLYAGRLTREQVLEGEPDGIQDVTRRYGVAAWTYAMGDPAKATAEWARLVEQGPWNAFGVIAAEADIARGRTTIHRPRR